MGVARLTTAALVLAAGAGTRFHGSTHKLVAPVRGRRLVDWAVDSALGAGLDETIVVIGAIHLTFGLDVTVVVNERWVDGQATSLAAGISAAACRGHDAVVVGLGDQPSIPSEAWSLLAASDAPIAVATYGGRRGHPVRLARTVWDLLPADGDEGARRVVQGRPDLVAEVACQGEASDVDTVEDLETWS